MTPWPPPETSSHRATRITHARHARESTGAYERAPYGRGGVARRGEHAEGGKEEKAPIRPSPLSPSFCVDFADKILKFIG